MRHGIQESFQYAGSTGYASPPEQELRRFDLSQSDTRPPRSEQLQYCAAPLAVEYTPTGSVYLVDHYRHILFHNGVEFLTTTDQLLFAANRQRQLICSDERTDRQIGTALSQNHNPCGRVIRVRNELANSALWISVQALTNRDKQSDSLFVITVFCQPMDKSTLVDHVTRSLDLTTAEKQVLDLMIEGYSNKAIARRRKVSPETVKKQCNSVLLKTGCANRTMLAGRILSAIDELQPHYRTPPQRRTAIDECTTGQWC